jgi:hypothetical protein
VIALLVLALLAGCASRPAPRPAAQVCGVERRWATVTAHGDTTEIFYVWRCREARR